MTYFPRDCVPGPGFEVFIFVKDSSLNPGRQNRTGIWQRWGCRASRNAFWFGSIPSTIHEHVSVAGAMTPFSNFGTSSTFFRILPMKCKRRKNSALITSKHTQWYITFQVFFDSQFEIGALNLLHNFVVKLVPSSSYWVLNVCCKIKSRRQGNKYWLESG
jgi:hypothetical protein